MLKNLFLSFKPAAVATLLLIGVVMAFQIHDEPPVGALKGRVVAQESGFPLDATVVLVRDRAHSREPYMNLTLGTRATDGAFDFRRVPVGDYLMSVSTRNRVMPNTKVHVDEGKTRTVEVELAPEAPWMRVYTHQHIFTPDEKPRLACTGYSHSDSLAVDIYKVDLDCFLIKSDGSLPKLVGVPEGYVTEQNYRPGILSNNAALKRTASFATPIGKRDAEGTYTQQLDIPRLAPGVYVVSVETDDTVHLSWLMVTSIGLVAKNAGTQTLAYVVDLKTGAPVPRADVKLYVSSKSVASGITDSSGILTLAAPGAKSGEDTVLLARSGDSYAFVSPSLSSMESMGDVIYAYTDRPVYRPGQMVYFKGVVRESKGNGYGPPSPRSVEVEVRDSHDTLIYRATKRTDDFGCYNGRLPINQEAATGSYTLVTRTGSEKPQESDDDEEGDEEIGPGEGVTFQVAAYKKPEYTVKITFDKKRYVRGDRVHATVSAEYYFGAPVARTRVKYVVRKSPYWLYTDQEETDDQDYGDESYSDYGGYGDEIVNSAVTTNSEGKAEIEFDAVWPQALSEYGSDSDQEFSIEASIPEMGGDVTATESVIATRGQFDVNATLDRVINRARREHCCSGTSPQTMTNMYCATRT